MTKREQEILHIIETNPLISQQELADELAITRSATAVHLSNLMKKGYIQGKGYIINYKPYICVVGGAFMDIVGQTHRQLIYNDTNLGSLHLTLGGVGRNIAETLVRLGIRTKLIAALGDDLYGKQILENGNDLAIDMHDSLVVKGAASSVLIAIMDENRDMALGLVASDINDKLDINFLKKKKEQIGKANLIVIDTNLSEQALTYLTENIKSSFFIDTVSASKAIRAKNILQNVQYLKTNVNEAGILWGQKIENELDLKRAAAFFHEKGIKKIFITRGKQGVFYSDLERSETIAANIVEEIVNTNGAGEAFSAGVIFSIFHDFSTIDAVKLGNKCAELTIKSHLNVSTDINEQMATQLTPQYFL